jgi:hypothetical protein
MGLEPLVLEVTLNDDDDNETRFYRLYAYECNETMNQSEQLTQPLQDLEGLEFRKSSRRQRRLLEERGICKIVILNMHGTNRSTEPLQTRSDTYATPQPLHHLCETSLCRT